MTHAPGEKRALPDTLGMDRDTCAEFEPGRVEMAVRDAELDETDAQQRAALEALAGMSHAADLLDPHVRAAARGDRGDVDAGWEAALTAALEATGGPLTVAERAWADQALRGGAIEAEGPVTEASSERGRTDG